MKQWAKEISPQKPAELQLIAPNLFIQRRNIVEQEHEEQEGQPAYTDFVCESREITESELAMLQSVEEIQTDKAVSSAIDEYTMQLMEGGLL